MSNIREVAKAAGVSVATVSRVINHDTEGRMTEETKERVWAAIADLNYKAPMGNIRKTQNPAKADAPLKIGCVISTEKNKYSDPYFLSMLSAIEEEARKNGCSVPYVIAAAELEESFFLGSTVSTSLDGIILMNTLSAPIYEHIKRTVPTLVGIDTFHNDIDNVVYNHYEAASMAVDTLVKKGYKKIGFVGAAPYGNKFTEGRRFRGYLAAMYSHNLPIDKETIIDCNWQEEACFKYINALHKKGKLPEAFVVASDLMAMAVLRRLYDLDVKVPAEVAVMGISDIEMSRFSNPPLSTIRIPTRDIGILAFRTLKERMSGYEGLPRTISLPMNVIIRSSI